MSGPLDPGAVGLLVIAKEPLPGRAKTRLIPELGAAGAARLAEAALADTLRAVAATPAPRRVLILDGAPGPWLPDGFEIVPQRGEGLGRRLAAGFDDAGAPALLIGMDTPQVTPELLEAGVSELCRPGTDAVLGPAEDGGWWALGLRRADPEVFRGVPMSTAETGREQRRRLAELDLSWAPLPALRDVDTLADARAVAAEAPAGDFARAVGELAVGPDG
jgi:uncharacterized protein